MISKKELYTAAMVESIKNAGMWLKEAKILARKGSSNHAQALLIFSGEELGKAAYCWFVRIGLIPVNHPEVDYLKGKKPNIFRSHPLKNATVLGLIWGIHFPELFPGDEINPEIIDPFTDAPALLRDVLSKLGEFTTKARTSWMYVDVIPEGEHFRVHSPLQDTPTGILDGCKMMEHTLNTFKRIVRQSPLSSDFVEWIDSMREYLREHDKNFPSAPIYA
ncbi:MAG: AbiV family abortive infection protein [Candidatus Lokiarchaeota archaeon]|nr:AbiV family abortive infection protein [Candidatus Lokiarchaeota archaeon]